jgi:trans-aconitate methyltransferase
LTLPQLDSDGRANNPTDGLVDLLLEQQGHAGPFVRWHLRRKFCSMEVLFRKYLTPGAKFVDMGCGKGDALLLASLCVGGCEEWGIDTNCADLQVAKQRIPSATFCQDDMHDPRMLPKQYFDIVHEFGAAFLSRGWDVLAQVYLSLLKDGGILLWELPQRWSLAHISYLLTVAPKRKPDETKFKRLLRSFLPSKYRFESDESVMLALQASGCEYEVLERISIGNFYFPAHLHWILDWGWRYFGDGLFELFDKVTHHLWPRDIGYYLVVRKKALPTAAAGTI